MAKPTCLVQVASDTDCYLVDPLAVLDLTPLFAALADRAKAKILHAARQDLEVMLNASGQIPGPVFDTQVAAALLGLPPQVGYAELVARQLGHSIDKGQTRTDWSRRPLSDAQLAYAADDVHHLLQLHTDLATALEVRGRAAWHAEECAALEDPRGGGRGAGGVGARIKARRPGFACGPDGVPDEGGGCREKVG